MTTATTFVRQNDASLRVRTSKYGQNLVLVVVLSLPADVLWGSFVTHSFLRGAEMNA